GVLIGAGDQDYLAVTGLVNLAIFAVAAAAVVASHGGLIALWLAFSVWMLARLATLTWRARGSRWLVTGAVRVRPSGGSPIVVPSTGHHDRRTTGQENQP
ncbi:MAG: hypothetical protein ACRDPO_38440, partial [Streptosporangiaceae bacterium]